MAHKYSLEALNRTLKDIKNNDKLFGCTLLVLSGDFRQTLPVIPRSTYADEINACLKSSTLWRNVEIVQLKVNMRVQMLQDPSAETFSKQLLDIGDGKVTIAETGYIKLANDFCTIIDSQDALIEQVFPDVHTNYINLEWLAERAMLAAKNVDVDILNLKIQQLLPGDLVSYKYIDTVCDGTEAVNFPTEFLNSLDLPGMPPHNLQLKLFKLRTRSGIGAKLEEYLSFPGVDLKAKSREHTTPLSPVADPQAARQLYESNPEDLATDLQSSRARRGRDCLKEK
ncbi:uncharacterized protein LOC114243194 [Bombyx mandarina]|uniref:ATP-dependent DNA helicase n=1 Tax=Bombyx mandarina TaxID=7092 RepID=A0A6J2JLK1_BOMMA|nr:uncharacterized protein LOC114243194 [Bombyx mandarina]